MELGKRRREEETTSQVAVATANGEKNMGSPIMRLSLAILRDQVFSFLAFQRLVPNGFDLDEFDAQLRPLRLVCRKWRVIAISMSSFQRGRVATIDFKDDESKRTAWIQPQIANAEQIKVVMGTMSTLRGKTGWDDHVHLSPYKVDGNVDPTEWTLVLDGASHLRRLDLTLVTPSQANAILSVVGRACHNMEALLLPLPTTSDSEGGVSYFKPLRSALETWFHSNGGLRQLRVPWVPEDEKNELLQAITAFCPRVEYLQSDRGKSLGSRLYDVPISTWVAFCDRCTGLRELDWSMVPSLRHYAQAFTAKTWTNLSILRIRFHPGEPNTPTQPRFVRSELRAVFAACPSLKVLELTAPSDADTGGEKFGFEDVLRDVTKCCPSLQSVRIRPTDGHSVIGLPRSRDLSPLLAMPSLSHLEVSDLKDEDGSSISNVLRLSPPYFRRRIVLRTRWNRHDAIVNVLAQLLDEESEWLAHLRLCIHVDDSWLRTEYPRPKPLPPTQLKEVLRRLKAKHEQSITRLHVFGTIMQTNDESEYIVLSGCELWINHQEAQELEGDRFKCELRPISS